ncbi:cysteine peptidase family C39 domain-containing protein [Enterococcus mundtii]|uniref:cysteine peptidase family C39 domain-containing protein n=1 Tax=Enterococcus TaxID=1350 RepID=UPI00336A32E1
MNSNLPWITHKKRNYFYLINKKNKKNKNLLLYPKKAKYFIFLNNIFIKVI